MCTIIVDTKWEYRDSFQKYRGQVDAAFLNQSWRRANVQRLACKWIHVALCIDIIFICSLFSRETSWESLKILTSSGMFWKILKRFCSDLSLRI